MTIWQLWWISLFVKIILLPILPITPDEAYYFAWSRHLSLSYYDHPPLIALLMKVAHPLWKTDVGVRWPGVIFGHLGYLPWLYVLAKVGFTERARFLWMLALLVSPLVGLGGFVITPDVPLATFWGLSIFLLLRAIETQSWIFWILFGLSTGLGLLSKYTMVLMYIAVLIWLLWSGRKDVLKGAKIWIAALISFACFIPVVLWNYQHDWASFSFQTRHGLKSQSTEGIWPLEYLGTQFALFNPFLALMGIWALKKNFSRYKLLTVFALVPFAFFFLTSFRARVEANWPVCGYPALMALAITVLEEKVGSKKWEAVFRTGLYASAVFVLLIISHTVHPWLPIRKDKDHTHITREFTEDVQAAMDFHPLFARSYQMAAVHSYYRPPEKEVFKIRGYNRRDAYDYFEGSDPQGPGYVILKPDDDLPAELKARYNFVEPFPLPSGHVVYKMQVK